MGNIHNNYARFEEQNVEMKKHVDNMYNLVNEYAKENGIKLSYTDPAEIFVEAIATYVTESAKFAQEKKPSSKYEMGQEIEFKLNASKEIKDVIMDKVSEDEVYYFEITEKMPQDGWYKGKLVGINAYVRTII